MEGHLSCCLLLVIKDKATMKIHVQVSVYEHKLLFYSGKYLGMRLLDHMGYRRITIRNVKWFPRVAVLPFYLPISNI